MVTCVQIQSLGTFTPPVPHLSSPGIVNMFTYPDPARISEITTCLLYLYLYISIYRDIYSCKYVVIFENQTIRKDVNLSCQYMVSRCVNIVIYIK